MTIRILDCLTSHDDPPNDVLLNEARESIERVRRVARTRSELSPLLRQLLADQLTEEKIEDLLRRPLLREDLSPEDILNICHVPAEPRPVARDTQRQLEAAE